MVQLDESLAVSKGWVIVYIYPYILPPLNMNVLVQISGSDVYCIPGFAEQLHDAVPKFYNYYSCRDQN